MPNVDTTADYAEGVSDVSSISDSSVTSEVDKESIALEDSKVDLVRPYLVLESILFPWTSSVYHGPKEKHDKGRTKWISKFFRRHHRSRFDSSTVGRRKSLGFSTSTKTRSSSRTHSQGNDASSVEDSIQQTQEPNHGTIGRSQPVEAERDWNQELRDLQNYCFTLLLSTNENDSTGQRTTAMNAIEYCVGSKLYTNLNKQGELQDQLLRKLGDNSCPCLWISPLPPGQIGVKIAHNNLVQIFETLSAIRIESAWTRSEHERISRAILRATCLRLEAKWYLGDEQHVDHVPLRLIRHSRRKQRNYGEAETTEVPSESHASGKGGLVNAMERDKASSVEDVVGLTRKNSLSEHAELEGTRNGQSKLNTSKRRSRGHSACTLEGISTTHQSGGSEYNNGEPDVRVNRVASSSLSRHSRHIRDRSASGESKILGHIHHSFSPLRRLIFPKLIGHSHDNKSAEKQYSSLMESLVYARTKRTTMGKGPASSLQLMDSLLLEGHILHNLYAGVVLDLLYDTEKETNRDGPAVCDI